MSGSSSSKNGFNPFSRIDDVSKISADDFLARFEEYGFVHLRLQSANDDEPLPKPQTVLSILNEFNEICEKNWTIENLGTCENQDGLKPTTLNLHRDRTFYASTIVHRKEKEAFGKLNSIVARKELDSLFQDLHLTSASWVFIGHHAIACATSQRDEQSSKRQKLEERSSLVGRAEHVDEVEYSGTFHIQLSGSKIWLIRPHPDLFTETCDQLPDLSNVAGSEQSPKTGAWRLRVEVQEGDVFVLNTNIWYHHTELPRPLHPGKLNGEEWSISLAQDFYLPIPCPLDVSESEVIFEEEQIPSNIPRSDAPNCALVEVDNDENEDEAKIVLVALHDMKEGDLLSIAYDENEDDMAEHNANEMIDPRAVSRATFDQGQVVLRGEDIPEELPRSFEPNCELHNDSGESELRALTEIKCGDVFSILPEKGGEYEQIEVDLGTGELLHRE